MYLLSRLCSSSVLVKPILCVFHPAHRLLSGDAPGSSVGFVPTLLSRHLRVFVGNLKAILIHFDVFFSHLKLGYYYQVYWDSYVT